MNPTPGLSSAQFRYFHRDGVWLLFGSIELIFFSTAESVLRLTAALSQLSRKRFEKRGGLSEADCT